MVSYQVLRCYLLLGAIIVVDAFQYPFQMKGRSSMHLLQMQHQTERHEQGNKRRTPANKRQAIKWVVQGVERCLAEEQLQVPPENNNVQSRKNNDQKMYTYKRREDASLVDALYLLVNAKNQKEVLTSSKRIEVLMRLNRGRQDFPVEVTERVIKATASAGLVAQSLDLLRRMLSDDIFPSSIAYTAVINALRKNGRVSQIEELLAEIAALCRRKNKQLNSGGDKVDVGLDIVAFNSFIAALCDAAIKGKQFRMSSSDNLGTAFEGFDDMLFGDSNSTNATASSEKYLWKALNLLRKNTAHKRFELIQDVDIYSFNTILSATAKCARSTASAEFSQYMIDVCLKELEERQIRKDSFTYNALIEIAVRAEDNGTKVIQLIDEVISLGEFDRYTINLALVPLLQSGRHHELMRILRSFYNSNRHNGKLVSSAFEAFLNTLVQKSEVDFAREIFDTFFLSSRRHKKVPSRFQMSREISVVTKRFLSSSLNGKNSAEEMKIDPIEPTTRHFNILFGGYNKSYRPVKSYRRRAESSFSSDEIDTPEDVSVSIAQNAYSLLDEMLKIGVPLDKFSVSSLVAFPTTSKDVTLLWKRIEPEFKAELSPASFRSIISAYADAGDPSSACWVFFGEMRQACHKRGMNVDCWNVLLGAIAKGAREQTPIILNPLNSTAALRNGKINISDPQCSENEIFTLVSGKACTDASLCILDAMRNRKTFAGSDAWSAPRPNSQTYCQVATALSATGTNPNPAMITTLFSFAKEDKAHTDGRFLNALLRCYGDDIDGALNAWKGGLASAAAGVGMLSDNSKDQSAKRSANLAAAYNGLMYVSGRSIRPDVALRLCYAMKTALIEPNEVSLNSYYSGKRIAMNGKADRRKLYFKTQFESLLQVECTKYTAKDKRRASDKKIRIILS